MIIDSATYLTASPKEVGDFGNPNIVCHMGFASSGSTPVDADIAIFQECTQLVFTKDLLEWSEVYHGIR